MSDIKQHAKKCISTEGIGGCDCDGYHTFDELYEHRITLWIALCKMRCNVEDANGSPFFEDVWKTKTHSDGSVMKGWFVLGVGTEAGEQITYHLPISRWDECDFAEMLERAPEFDGHTSDEVIERLKRL